MYTPTKTYPAAPLRILVVEDNFFNQKVAVGMLQKMGHAVTVANNGREAVTTTEASGFDLIFMDIQMPEMDGFQATAAIRQRQRESGKRVPIIAMTAHVMAGDREKALAAGMDDYISKPLMRDELKKIVERNSAISEEATGREVPASPEPTERSLDFVLDPGVLKNRFGGDQELLTTIAEMFPGETAKALQSVERARTENDAVTLRREAHSLKSMCKMFEATHAAGLALELETAAEEGSVGTDQQLQTLKTAVAAAAEAVVQFQKALNPTAQVQ